MLFDDDHFEEKDSIVFDWSPMWWGMGPEQYNYTRTKLQETILGQMEASGWMGVCCEPNTVFIICNQFPVFLPYNTVTAATNLAQMIATRYNDVRKGTHIIDEVLANYKQAWAKHGFLSKDGLFRKYYSVRQNKISDWEEISHSAWSASLT